MPRRKQSSESDGHPDAKRSKDSDDCEESNEADADWKPEEKEILILELDRKSWKNMDWSALQQKIKTKTEEQIKRLAAQMKVQRQVIESSGMVAKDTTPLQVWTEFASQVTDPGDTMATQCIPQNHDNGSAVEVLTSLGQVSNPGHDTTMESIAQQQANPTHVQAITTLPNDGLMNTANTDQVVIYVQSEDIHRTHVQQHLQQESANSGRREGVVELSEALNNMLENQIKILRMLEDQNRRIETLTAELNELKTLSPITTSLVQLLQLVQQQTHKIDQLQKSGSGLASGANTIVIQTPGNSTVIQAPSNSPSGSQTPVKDLTQENKVAASSPAGQVNTMKIVASNSLAASPISSLKTPTMNRVRPVYRFTPVVKNVEDGKNKDRLVAVGGNPAVQLPFWLYEDTIVRSRKPTLLAIHLSEAVFGTNTLLSSTPTGRYGMSSLDPVKLMAIKAEVISRFMESSTKQEKEDMWKNCITSIAKKCQALRSAHGLSSLTTPPRATSTEDVLQQQNVGETGEIGTLNVSDSSAKSMSEIENMEEDTSHPDSVAMDTEESGNVSISGGSDGGGSLAGGASQADIETLSIRSDKIVVVGGLPEVTLSAADYEDAFLRGNRPTTFAMHLAEKLYGFDTLVMSTPTGRQGLQSLDPLKLKAIKVEVTKRFLKDKTPAEQHEVWKHCLTSIAKKCQALRFLQKTPGTSPSSVHIRVPTQSPTTPVKFSSTPTSSIITLTPTGAESAIGDTSTTVTGTTSSTVDQAAVTALVSSLVSSLTQSSEVDSMSSLPASQSVSQPLSLALQSSTDTQSPMALSVSQSDGGVGDMSYVSIEDATGELMPVTALVTKADGVSQVYQLPLDNVPIPSVVALDKLEEKGAQTYIYIGGTRHNLLLPIAEYRDALFKGRKATTFASCLALKIFGSETMMNSTVTGRADTNRLDQNSMAAVKDEVLARFAHDKSRQDRLELWKNCQLSIATKCKSLRYKVTSLSTESDNTSVRSSNSESSNAGETNMSNEITAATSGISQEMTSQTQLSSSDLSQLPAVVAIIQDTGGQTLASVPGQIALAGAQISTIDQPFVASSMEEALGSENSDSYELVAVGRNPALILQKSDYDEVFSKTDKPQEFACLLAEKIFGTRAMSQATVDGFGDGPKLDAEKIDAIKVEITQRFLAESSKEDKDEVINLCLSALAEKCQAIRESIEKANESAS